jgi:hypothetical protein
MSDGMASVARSPYGRRRVARSKKLGVNGGYQQPPPDVVRFYSVNAGDVNRIRPGGKLATVDYGMLSNWMSHSILKKKKKKG